MLSFNPFTIACSTSSSSSSSLPSTSELTEQKTPTPLQDKQKKSIELTTDLQKKIFIPSSNQNSSPKTLDQKKVLKRAEPPINVRIVTRQLSTPSSSTLSAIDQIHLALALDLLKAQLSASKMQSKTIRNLNPKECTKQKSYLKKETLAFLNLLVSHGALAVCKLIQEDSQFKKDFILTFNITDLNSEQAQSLYEKIVEHYFLIDNYDIFTSYIESL